MGTNELNDIQWHVDLVHQNDVDSFAFIGCIPLFDGGSTVNGGWHGYVARVLGKGIVVDMRKNK